MTDTILEIHPLSPLLFRDGRPFASGGEESRARSLPLPLPHTLAGFVRTQLGNAEGTDWSEWCGLSDEELHARLKILHAEPVRAQLVRYRYSKGKEQATFLFAAPLNAVVDKNGKVYRSLPTAYKDGEGSDLPADLTQDLLPCVLKKDGADDFKPEKGYNFWTQEDITSWLLNQIPTNLEKISGPVSEERTHVSIDPATGAGQEGKLFSVSYSSFESNKDDDYQRYALRIKFGAGEKIAGSAGSFGGERRPVALQELPDGEQPFLGKACFDDVRKALLDEKNKRICFILTSPALFAYGWCPAWLAKDPLKDLVSQKPCGVSALVGKCKLVGAVVGRRVAVSGWNVRTNKPKAVRWAAPAGSVYFLELEDGVDREKLLNAFLRPLSDNENDRRDGFGCALWGVW